METFTPTPEQRVHMAISKCKMYGIKNTQLKAANQSLKNQLSWTQNKLCAANKDRAHFRRRASQQQNKQLNNQITNDTNLIKL